MIIITISGVVIHIQERVTARDDEGSGGQVPFKPVEFGSEGISQDEVVVDEFAIRAARAVGNTPAEGLGGTGEDLADATAVLETDLVGMDMVTEATGLNDGNEAPAKLGFFLLGEFDRDNPGREGMIEQRPETFADAGGIDDDVLRMPGFGRDSLILPKTAR